MKRCEVTERELASWYDGLLGAPKDMADHVERCESCSARIEVWRRSGDHLRGAIDSAIGEVEPLIALQAIRQRIATQEKAGLMARLRSFWDDLWVFNRRAVAGLATAAALGALTAPAVAYWMGGQGAYPGDARVASVVVEELEYAGNAKAVVYHPDNSNTTIIWVEPADAAKN
jgi:anti-sigma factor RsiW